MITTIVFDIGNVLAHFGWKEYLNSCGYDEETLFKLSNATVGSRMWKEWDRGSREETELIELTLKENPEIKKEITAFFDHVLTMVKEYDYSPNLIKKLKEHGYRIYVLSNYSRWHFEHDRENFEFIQYIDGGVVSYQVNHVKPEAAIYEALINKCNLNPNEAVFIDDVQENLDGAKPFGFRTILMQSYDQMLGDLRNMGVNI